MRQYFLRRLLLTIPTIVGITLLISGLVRLLPGDAVDLMAEEFAAGSAGELAEAEAELRQRLGLDRSWPEQYLRWAWGLLQGDLGVSLRGSERSVWEEIRGRLPVSFELGLLGLLAGLALALPIGVYSALRRDTAGDYLARSLAIALLALPGFWLATLLIAVVLPELGLPPLPIRYRELWEEPLEHVKQIWAPALIIGLAVAAPLMRLVRTQMLEGLQQDFVGTARAKGLRERQVLRHALRNALIPVITLVGLQLPLLLSGAVVMEQIFVLPGIGVRLLSALAERDVPVILGINLVVAGGVVLANLLVDLSYSLLDPRIRHS